MSEDMHKRLFLKKKRSYAFILTYTNDMSEDMYKIFFKIRSYAFLVYTLQFRLLTSIYIYII